MARCCFENDFKALEDFCAWAEAERVPLSVHWDVTWQCDLRCAHCYLTDRENRELTLAEASDLLDQLAGQGTMSLLLSGGDPFVRPNFLQIVEMARKRWFEVRIITNGLRIDDNIAESLEKLGVRQVSMSLYSADPREHDALTLKPGSFEAVMRAAKALKRAGLPICFKTVVTRKNTRRFKQLAEIVEEFDASWEVTPLVFPAHDGSSAPLELALDDEARKAFFAWDFERLGWKPEWPLPLDPKAAVCSAGRSSLYVAPDGAVFPCINWNLRLGSIREAPLREIWNSPMALQSARVTREDLLQACKDCNYVNLCDFCPGTAEILTGKCAQKNDPVCRNARCWFESIEASLAHEK